MVSSEIFSKTNIDLIYLAYKFFSRHVNTFMKFFLAVSITGQTIKATWILVRIFKVNDRDRCIRYALK